MSVELTITLLVSAIPIAYFVGFNLGHKKALAFAKDAIQSQMDLSD